MAALRIQENEEYVRYVTAGGEPNKWEWVFNIERYKIEGVTPEEVGDLITKQIAKKLKGVGGTKREFFDKRQLPVIRQLEDGSIIDEHGKKIEMPNDALFIPLNLVEAMPKR